jgi:hypothetical protein
VSDKIPSPVEAKAALRRAQVCEVLRVFGPQSKTRLWTRIVKRYGPGRGFPISQRFIAWLWNEEPLYEKAVDELAAAGHVTRAIKHPYHLTLAES